MSTEAHSGRAEPDPARWRPFDLSPDAVFVCVDRRVRWANHAARILLGWPDGELDHPLTLPADPTDPFDLAIVAESGQTLDFETRSTGPLDDDSTELLFARPVADRRTQVTIQRAIARFIVSATALSSTSSGRSHDIELELGRLLGDYTEFFRFDRVELIDQTGRLALSAEQGMIELDGGEPVPTGWRHEPRRSDDDLDRNVHLVDLAAAATTDPDWVTATEWGYRSASRLTVGPDSGEVRFFHRVSRPLIDQVEFHALFAQVILAALHSGREVGRLRFAAAHDPMTGLANRVGFRSGIERLVSAEGTAVLFIDLDGFKAVNDVLGHHVGDAVLGEAARRLREQLRPGDLAARLGGDEFAVAVTTAVPQHLDALCRRLAAAIEVEMPIGPHLVRVGASIGYAVRGPGDSVDDVLAAADEAMYRIKQHRRAPDPSDRRTPTS